MGTSVNHSSPNVPIWRLPKTVLGNPNWPVNRQSDEVWQAALADRDGKLASELSDPLFARACEIADRDRDPISAVDNFDNALSNQYASGLVFEMGRRALARAVAIGTGSSGFASELFVETVAYYVARDLPSIVGTTGRIQTINAAMQLKDTIKNIARETVQKQGVPNTDPPGWRTYVEKVLLALQSTGQAL